MAYRQVEPKRDTRAVLKLILSHCGRRKSGTRVFCASWEMHSDSSDYSTQEQQLHVHALST